MHSDIIEMFSRTPGKVVMLSDLAGRDDARARGPHGAPRRPADRQPRASSATRSSSPGARRSSCRPTTSCATPPAASGASSPTRAEAEAWLGELLTPKERAALKTALGT